MKSWQPRAALLLSTMAEHPPHRLDELQGFPDLPGPELIAEHVCAMANQAGGGFFAFGVDDQGKPSGNGRVNDEATGEAIRELARSAVTAPVIADYAIEQLDGNQVLLVHVHESSIKPVVCTGQPLDHTFIRSSGMTRRASRQEIGGLLLNSRTPRWEELHASTLWPNARILSELDIGAVAKLIGRPTPDQQEDALALLSEQGLIVRVGSDAAHVTHLGAISASHRLVHFPDIARKAVRVVVYDGATRQRARLEKEGQKGYAIGFDGLMSFVTGQLPQSEVIDRAFRQKMPMYPEVALREIIANALIHQDFSVAGAGPLVEIFGDRIEISNPGGLLPSKRADRLFSTSSESRNERLARTFRLYGICEERGSGLFRAGRAIELYGLPPVRFDAGTNHFKVTLYSPKTYAQMSASERLQACYQHSVIQFVAGEYMTNKSLRERLRMPEARRSMVSTLIQHALDTSLIKPADPDNRSKKFMQYLPIWA